MPYAIALIVWLASLAGSAWWAWHAGADAERGQIAKTASIEQRAIAAAADAAASAVSSIRVRNNNIVQEVRHEIETRAVYRDCEHSAGQLQRINAALGAAAAAEPAGGSQLHTADASHQPDLRGHDREAAGSGHSVPRVPGVTGAEPVAPAP